MQATSSPGCANFALKKTASDYEGQCGSEAASFVKNDFYVDDGLKSVPTPEAAISLVKNTKMLCAKGGFNLHKFISNHKAVIDAIPHEDIQRTSKTWISPRTPSLSSGLLVFNGALSLTHYSLELS